MSLNRRAIKNRGIHKNETSKKNTISLQRKSF